MEPCYLWALAAILTSCWACPRVDGQTDNLIAAAIGVAQTKMVKVYGAAAGRVEGYATGFAISSDGKILTTQGVFLDGTQVRVVTPDGLSHRASILKRDREHQIALLQIAAETPDYFDIPDTEVGEKGDWVIAISNAFKVAEKQEPLSATLGVISLRSSIEARLNQRDVAYHGTIVLLDQITSNPGAAGGVVITLSGQLVGMLGKIIESSETNTRLNYAIPNSVLREFLASGEAMGSDLVPPTPSVYLGIELFAHGGRNSPAYIDRVVRGSPAFQAQLKADDLLISLAGEKIGNLKDYQQALSQLRPGEEAIIVVKRGKELLRMTVVPRVRE